MAQPDEHFEIAGKKVVLTGTSGPPVGPARTAEGRPVYFDEAQRPTTLAADLSTDEGAGEIEGGPIEKK